MTPTPFHDALFLTHNAPTNLPADHDYPIRVTFQNTGNVSWSAATFHELGVTTDTCALVSSGAIAIPPGVEIQPGASHPFDFVLHAPASGPCSLGLRMNQPGGAGFFGQSLALNFEVVPPQNNAQMISNTLPETMTPNQSLHVGISVRNTGNTPWLPGSEYALAVTGTPCMIPESTRIVVRAGDAVLPGQTYQFIGRITAPATTGPCGIDFQMIEESVGLFGQALNESIQVQEPANATSDWLRYE